MNRILILLVLASLLISCVPNNTDPTPTLLPTFTPPTPPTLTPTTVTTPTPTNTPEPPSYLSRLEINWSDEVLNYKYQVVYLNVLLGVDSSLKNRARKVTFTDERLANTGLRLLRSIFQPENKGDVDGLRQFGKDLSHLQKGESTCGENYKSTINLFDANGNSAAEEMILVPDCGGMGVPEGAYNIKGVRIVYGNWADLDPQIGRVAVVPNLPWFDMNTGSGGGSGLLFDKRTGELIVLIGVGIDRGSRSTLADEIAMSTEITIDWLSNIALNGKSPDLGNLNRWYYRGQRWAVEVRTSR